MKNRKIIELAEAIHLCHNATESMNFAMAKKNRLIASKIVMEMPGAYGIDYGQSNQSRVVLTLKDEIAVEIVARFSGISLTYRCSEEAAQMVADYFGIKRIVKYTRSAYELVNQLEDDTKRKRF